MAIKCPKCHSENPDTQSFCDKCGTQIIAPVGEEVSVTNTLLTPTKDLIKGTFPKYQIGLNRILLLKRG